MLFPHLSKERGKKPSRGRRGLGDPDFFSPPFHAATALRLEKGHAATRPREQLQISTWRLILLFAPLTSAPPLWPPQGGKIARRHRQDSQAGEPGTCRRARQHDKGSHRPWLGCHWILGFARFGDSFPSLLPILPSAPSACRVSVREASWQFPQISPLRYVPLYRRGCTAFASGCKQMR